MLDVSRLIDALEKDNVDQRAVADHLVSLAKVLKNSTGSTSTLEYYSPKSARTLVQEPAPSSPPAPAAASSPQSQSVHHVQEIPEANPEPGLEPEPGQDPESESSRALREKSASTEDPAASVVVSTSSVSLPQESDRGETHGNARDMQQDNSVHATSDESGAPPDGFSERSAEVASLLTKRNSLLVELIRTFRAGMLRVESNLRAAMFRAVRYLVLDTQVHTNEDAELIRQERFGLFIALALARERDSTKLMERLQALKLVKRIMAVDSSMLPREVVRTVVAVSGHKEDNFRRVCLETLRELAVAHPSMVAHANGFRVLLAAAVDPANQDLADPLVTTLMAIIEDPTTRQYARPHLELHQLLTGFTDLDAPPGPERTLRWKSTRKALVVAMRSWAGVHLLASDSRGLVTVMRLLRDPSPSFTEDASLQDSILDTIVDIFEPLMGMGRASSSAQAGLKSRGISFVDKLFTPFSGSTATLSQRSTGCGLRTRKGSEPHDLLLSYAAILCAAFVHCGLIPSLTTLSISAGSEELRAKAATLLVDVLRLCAMLLSQNQCTRLLSMPGLVRIAAESQMGSLAALGPGARSCHLTRSRASRASDLIRLLHRALGPANVGPSTTAPSQQHPADVAMVSIGELLQKVCDADVSFDSAPTHKSCMGEATGTLEQMRKELRSKIESTVEKSVMDNQMNKSKVLTTKDWTKWDWDVIDDIVQDTLPHTPRLLDALRTKWIRRVSGFYRFVGAGAIGTSTERGGGGGLHNLRWDPDHVRHISCAGRLYSTLLQQSEGVHFLQTDARGGILQEIVKELQGLMTRRWSVGGSGRFIGPSKVFDMESCQRRLSGGYIALLFNVAAGTDAGRELFANAGLWTHLSNMVNQPELDYLSRLVMTRIDLNSDSCAVPRDLLRSWMTTGSSQLRLFAVNLLRAALKRGCAEDSENRDPMRATSSASASRDMAPSDEWCLGVLLAHLHGDDPVVSRATVSVLEEVTQDERCLRFLVNHATATPELVHVPGTSKLLMSFLSLPEGIRFLENLGWVERMMQEWKANNRTTRYSESVDAIWKAHVNEAEHIEDPLHSESMPERGSGSRRGSGVAIPITTRNISQTVSESFISGASEGRDMQILMTLPWNIEVMLSRNAVPTCGMQLRVDTWVDASPKGHTSSASAAAATSVGRGKSTSASCTSWTDEQVVRGTLVDPAGKPTCHPLEAHLTLHARLCIGDCPVDRHGIVQWQAGSPMDKQAAPFGKNRSSRTSRAQWSSPQHTRDDHMLYGGNTSYRGVQGMPDFVSSHDLRDDPADIEHRRFWSTCRPRQRTTPRSRRGHSRSDGSKDGGRAGMGVHTVSPLSKTLDDEAVEAEYGEDFPPPSRNADHARKDSDVSASNVHAPERAVPEGYERVVDVRDETARWVFTNQPEPEDTISMQVVENTSVTYLKAVEMTICLKDVGPPALLLPPHLYGELARTERGCEVLRKHGDLENLLRLTRNASRPADERQGALWALAHVTSWTLGLTLLEELQENVIAMLLSLCTSESHLSVWGTSLCVVSLLARTGRGKAALRAAGWESARDPSTGIFLPQDPTILFQPVPWNFGGALTQGLAELPSDPVIERLWQDLAANDAEVLHQVAKLSSHISRKEAMRKLSRMRKDAAHKACFTESLPVFLLVHQLLADYSFSLPMRRYIFELLENIHPRRSEWEPYIV